MKKKRITRKRVDGNQEYSRSQFPDMNLSPPSSLPNKSSSSDDKPVMKEKRSTSGVPASYMKKLRRLKQQKQYLAEIRREILPTIPYVHLVNSIVFFEENIEYFVKHPFEFQRLVGQLEYEPLQSSFQQLIFNYYYADILFHLFLGIIGGEKKFQEAEEQLEHNEGYVTGKSKEKANEDNGMSEGDEQDEEESVVSKLHSQFMKEITESERGGKSTHGIQTDAFPSQSLPVSGKKIATIFKSIQKMKSAEKKEDTTEKGTNKEREFQKLLLQCNSQECFILEHLLLDKPLI